MKFKFVNGKTYNCEVITPPRGTFAISLSNGLYQIDFPVAILFIKKRRWWSNSTNYTPMGYVSEDGTVHFAQYISSCLEKPWCDAWLKGLDNYFRRKYGKETILRVMLPPWAEAMAVAFKQQVDYTYERLLANGTVITSCSLEKIENAIKNREYRII